MNNDDSNNDQDQAAIRAVIYDVVSASCASAPQLNNYNAACQKAATFALAGENELAKKWQAKATELLDGLIDAWTIEALQHGPSSDRR